MMLRLLVVAIAAVAAIRVQAGGSPPPPDDPLKIELQSIIDNLSVASGYSFSVGYVDADRSFGIGSGPRSPPDLETVVRGTVGPHDTMALGSGSKPYTAAAVLKLVEAGKLKLDDPVAPYVDPTLAAWANTSLVGLYGGPASNVTVGHLIRMQSGIDDYDVPDFDHSLLLNSSTVHPPLQALREVANSGHPFVCPPGTCTSYSSTNFIIAGIVLFHFSDQKEWSTLTQAEALGLSYGPGTTFPDTYFANIGPLHESGLTVAGSSLQYGDDEIWAQDSSINGWTCGNVVASARDVAQFYYDLLAPPHATSLLAPATVAAMQNWTVLTTGWAANYIAYGTGLMVQNVSPKNENERPMPPLFQTNETASYIGHGGDTFAFESDNGYFPQLKASISVIVNQDHDDNYPTNVATCAVAQAVARHRGLKDDFGCRVPPPEPVYECSDVFGAAICAKTSYANIAVNKSSCDSFCGTQWQCAMSYMSSEPSCVPSPFPSAKGHGHPPVDKATCDDSCGKAWVCELNHWSHRPMCVPAPFVSPGQPNRSRVECNAGCGQVWACQKDLGKCSLTERISPIVNQSTCEETCGE